MNPKSTWAWVVVAAGLFAFIMLVERRLHLPPAPPAKMLAGLNPATVRTVQIHPASQRPIRLVRTNGTWRIVQPVVYPARAASVDLLLDTLAKLTAARFIPPADLRSHARANEEFGFNPPQLSLTLDPDGQERSIWIGSRTPPGDQVYAQVVGEDGIHLLDAGLLKLIPAAANDWRDPALVNFSRFRFDGIVVTNAGNVLELQRDPTNQLWLMLSPNKTRADSLRVEEALQRLQTLRVDEFVSDDPKADLDAYGLLNPEFSLGFRQGTNTVFLLDFGASPTNVPGRIYARRASLNSVVAVAREGVEPWRASRDFSDFFDRHLIAFPGAPDIIEVQGDDQFTLQRQTNHTWRIVGPDNTVMTADEAEVSQVISNLAALQVVKIVRHVVPAPELASYGLDTPARRYILKTAGAATNSVIASLDIGIKDNQVFAKRTGESTVYSLNPADLGVLPWISWQIRDRRIWNFAPADAERITIREGGRVRELVRDGTDSWKLAPGSQGILDEVTVAAIEETVHGLGVLSAVTWLERGDQNRAAYGFKPDGWQITVGLQDGRKLTVEFGAVASTGFASALTTLDGEPWIFEFPQRTYLHARTYLAIPPDSP